MSQIFSGIGNALGKFGSAVGTPPFVPSGTGGGAEGAGTFGKIFNTGLLGIGQLGNYLQQRRYNQIYDNYNNLLRSYSDPAQLAARIAALKQPLSLGLKQNVGNTVQAMMAERGLGQAPGLFESALVQALAPYDLKNTEMAISAAQLPAGLNPMYALATGKPNPADMSGLIQKLGQVWGNGKAASPMEISTYQGPQGMPNPIGDIPFDPNALKNIFNGGTA